MEFRSWFVRSCPTYIFGRTRIWGEKCFLLCLCCRIGARRTTGTSTGTGTGTTNRARAEIPTTHLPCSRVLLRTHSAPIPRIARAPELVLMYVLSVFIPYPVPTIPLTNNPLFFYMISSLKNSKCSLDGQSFILNGIWWFVVRGRRFLCTYNTTVQKLFENSFRRFRSRSLQRIDFKNASKKNSPQTDCQRDGARKR